MTPKFQAGDIAFLIMDRGKFGSKNVEKVIVNVKIKSLYCRLGKRTKKPSIMAYIVEMPFDSRRNEFDFEYVYVHEPNLWTSLDEALKNQHKITSGFIMDWKIK